MKMKEDGIRLFGLIRSYLTDYLPNRRNASSNTVRAYRTVLNQFLGHVTESRADGLVGATLADFDGEHVSGYLDRIESGGKCSIKTRNHRLNCLRAFVSYAASTDIGAISLNDSLRKIPYKALASDEPVKFMSERAVNALLRAPDRKTNRGRRDFPLLAFMYDSASRVQECVGLRLSDVDLGECPKATLRGKGRKTRQVPLMDSTARVLRRYVAEFHPDAPLHPDAPMFYARGTGVKKRLTEDWVRKLLARYGDISAASEPEVPGRVHPHMLRHSRAMHLYQSGMRLELLSQWLGHAQLETTLIYAHADSEMKRKAIEAATPVDSPLGRHVKPARMKIEDDDTIRKLYGLK